MDFEDAITMEQPALERRLRRIVGSHELAEDLAQETVIRAWERGPRAGNSKQLRAWMHRVAANLAIDEARRGRRHPQLPLDEEAWGSGAAFDTDENLALQEALGRLVPHQRMLLLMRFEADLTYREIAALLDISEDAVRQRLSRARRAFSEAAHGRSAGRKPRVYVLSSDDPPTPYVEWLEEAGADARLVRRDRLEQDIALADALVVTGGTADVDSRVYGELPRGPVIEPNIERDQQDLAAIKAALEQDIPLVGICRGHQLLNVLFGGTLYQDLKEDRVATAHGEQHSITTGDGSFARRVFGRRSEASSSHHQAVSRIGRGLRAVATSDDDVNEAVEVPRRRFALGVQFHPEERRSDGDLRLAKALVDAAAVRAA